MTKTIDKPDNRVYMTFTPDTSDESAIAAFHKRFGRDPQYIMRFAWLVWVGPVSDEPAYVFNGEGVA